jgi:hypothetical protein
MCLDMLRMVILKRTNGARRSSSPINASRTRHGWRMNAMPLLRSPARVLPNQQNSNAPRRR